MSPPCIFGAVTTQVFMWKHLCAIYTFSQFIRLFINIALKYTRKKKKVRFLATATQVSAPAGPPVTTIGSSE